MIKNTQTQKQSQGLKILPQQIQFLNLLQLNALELDQYLNKELEENPYLEYQSSSSPIEDNQEYNDGNSNESDFGENVDWSSYDDDIPNYNFQTENGFSGGPDRQFMAVEPQNWRNSIKNQLKFDDSINAEKYELAEFIIDSLEDDGKLNQSLDALTDNISLSRGQFIDTNLMAEALQLVQDLDPPGIGARDLRECLLIQVDRLKILDFNLETIQLARTIIDSALDLLANHNYEKIKEKLDIDTEDLKEAIDLITNLNPHPISFKTNDIFAGKSVITPDFLIEIEGEEIIVSLPNSKVGAIRLGKEAEELSKQKLDKKATNFLKMKIEDAKWLEQALRQRDSSMIRTMRAIVNHQRLFFLTGDRNDLQPMILKDIAEIVDLDVSTISRITSHKYVQTPYGIFPVKDLFVQSFTNSEGDTLTTNEIQIALQEIIDAEDKTKPFNDTELKEKLALKGFQVARRTIAKYRENLKIPIADIRRELI